MTPSKKNLSSFKRYLRYHQRASVYDVRKVSYLFQVGNSATGNNFDTKNLLFGPKFEDLIWLHLDLWGCTFVIQVLYDDKRRLRIFIRIHQLNVKMNCKQYVPAMSDSALDGSCHELITRKLRTSPAEKARKESPKRTSTCLTYRSHSWQCSY